MIIILAQQQLIHPDNVLRWEDMKIPEPPGPPRRRDGGITVVEFAERLREAGLEGVYRAVTQKGVFRIKVTRHDAFGVAVTEDV